METADAGPSGERLVDEHRHGGRIRQLLLETSYSRAARPWSECTSRTPFTPRSCRRSPANRSTAPTNTRSLLKRALRRRSMPSGRSPLYDSGAVRVGNVLNRFAVSSWMPFKYNADGSLDLYFRRRESRKGQGSQLAPGTKGRVQSDRAALCSKSEALTGRWRSPSGHTGAANGGFVGSVNADRTPALRAGVRIYRRLDFLLRGATLGECPTPRCCLPGGWLRTGTRCGARFRR